MGKFVNYTEEDRGCDLCGNDSFKPVREKTKFAPTRLILEGDKVFNANDVMCDKCGLVYKRPILSEQSMRDFYEKEYVALYTPNMALGIPKSFLAEVAIDTIYFLKWLKEINFDVHGKKVLNIGSGAGITSYFLECLGAHITSIEPALRSYEISKKLFNIPVVNGFYEDYTTDEKYDVIVLSNTLEHFYSPSGVVEKARLMLKDDGCILIQIPDVLLPYPSTMVDGWLSSAHNYNFTFGTIEALLNKHRLEIDAQGEGAKSKMLIKAIKCEQPSMKRLFDVEVFHKNLFDVFREKDLSNVTYKKYEEELFKTKDVIAIGREIYNNHPLLSNFLILRLTEKMWSEGKINEAWDFINSVEYKTGTPTDVGTCEGTFFYMKAFLARQKGDIIMCRNLLNKAFDAYPPFDSYNPLKYMLLNGIISEPTLSKHYYWAAKQLMQTLN